jgi:hypothetical protein
MTITSLRCLPEPAYIRLGSALPDRLGYFTRLRSRTQAVAELQRLGEPSASLRQLVTDGRLLELPALDEQATRARLSDLTLQGPETYQTPVCVKYDIALIRVPDRPDRAVGVSTVTAEILAAARTAPLGAAVVAAAAHRRAASCDLWRGLLHDLTGVLLEGVVALTRSGLSTPPRPV